MISDKEIEKLVHVQYKDHWFPPSTIYHYTNASVVNKILTDDGIVLRLTKVSDFSDVYEGKSIEIYYDMALEQLESEGAISVHQRTLFNDVRLPEKRLAIFDLPHKEDQPRSLATSVNMTPYIICFSKNKCDSYMFENYIRTENQGYCLEFYGLDIASNSTTLSFGKGHKFQFYNVLYGNEIINTIKQLICEMLSCFEKIDDQIIKQFLLGILEGKLQDLQYSAKLSKYKQENEVRLVLFIPEPEECPANYSPLYQKTEENGKSYVYIKVHKHTLSGIYSNDKVNIQTKSQLKQTLLDNGYEVDVK